jgi:hypothetical protein
MHTKPTLICFLGQGINAPGLPPAVATPRSSWHPLRQHLLFMDDVEGLTALIHFYYGLLQLVPQLRQVFDDPGWMAPSAPPFRTTLELLPDNGRIQLDWRPDGYGLRVCRHLVEIDTGVSFNGNALSASLDDAGWSVAWPPELGLSARIAGVGTHALTLTPHAFNLTPMLERTNHLWLEQSSIQADWVSAVWEWQKVALLWLALYRLEHP